MIIAFLSLCTIEMIITGGACDLQCHSCDPIMRVRLLLFPVPDTMAAQPTRILDHESSPYRMSHLPMKIDIVGIAK